MLKQRKLPSHASLPIRQPLKNSILPSTRRTAPNRAVRQNRLACRRKHDPKAEAPKPSRYIRSGSTTTAGTRMKSTRGIMRITGSTQGRCWTGKARRPPSAPRSGRGCCGPTSAKRWVWHRAHGLLVECPRSADRVPPRRTFHDWQSSAFKFFGYRSFVSAGLRNQHCSGSHMRSRGGASPLHAMRAPEEDAGAITSRDLRRNGSHCGCTFFVNAKPVAGVMVGN